MYTVVISSFFFPLVVCFENLFYFSRYKVIFHSNHV